MTKSVSAQVGEECREPGGVTDHGTYGPRSRALHRIKVGVSSYGVRIPFVARVRAWVRVRTRGRASIMSRV